MSLLLNGLYEFEKFRLDTREKVLTKENVAVEITPKTFELLCMMVENHGSLVSKEDLMARLWPDSYVEESNLTYTIRQLRKCLDDTVSDPKFIRTVPRYGYRFVAEVTEIERHSTDPGLKDISVEPVIPEPEALVVDESQAVSIKPDFSPTSRTSLGQFASSVSLVVFLSVTIIAGASWLLLGSSSSAASVPLMSRPFSSTQLTTTGGVHQAAISPDGKRMVYSSEISGVSSIWVRDIASSESLQIVPDSPEFYFGLSVAPDNSTLYFARGLRLPLTEVTIYRTSMSGGLPKEIAKKTQGWFSISPNGEKISFIRCAGGDEDYCSLYVANVDGSNEKKLITRPRPIGIQENQFSPDGRTIAFANGHSRNGGREIAISEVDIETGVERQMSQQKFFQVRQFQWLPDKSGLLVTLGEEFYKPMRVYMLSATTGEIQPLSPDSSDYNHVSLDKAADRMVTTQFAPKFAFTKQTIGAPASARTLAFAFSDFTVTPSGKIIFSSTNNGYLNLWSMDSDGTNQRQLTTGGGSNWHPVVSPDERYVYFTSNRSGSNRLWRMNMDGTDLVQLPEEDINIPVTVSADGKSLYFLTALNPNLRRIDLDSPEKPAATVLSGSRIAHPAIDPTQKFVAYFTREGAGGKIVVRSIGDEKVVHEFGASSHEFQPRSVAWSPDGGSLIYLVREGGKNILWRQPLKAASKPERIDDLGEEEVTDVVLAADSKTLYFIRGRWNHDAFLIEGLH